MVLQQEAYNVVGAIYEVHSQLGCGFQEKVYQAAMEQELTLRGIPFEREKQLEVFYKDVKICDYYADFVCYGQIILEMKAVSELNDMHRAQILNYLKATRLPLGILANFGSQSADIERYANTQK